MLSRLFVLGLFASLTSFGVTPAHLAYEKVEPAVINAAKKEMNALLAGSADKYFIVATEMTLGRGKYSTEAFGFCDYLGGVNFTVVKENTDQYQVVECGIDAKVNVVPASEVEGQVLELSPNDAALVLERTHLSCRLKG